MSNKDEVAKIVTTWINIDTQIDKLKKDLKKLTEQKKKMSSVVATIMKKEDTDEFKVGSHLVTHTERTVTSNISKKLLLSLAPQISPNPKEAERIINLILNARTISTKDLVERKPINNK